MSDTTLTIVFSLVMILAVLKIAHNIIESRKIRKEAYRDYATGVKR